MSGSLNYLSPPYRPYGQYLTGPVAEYGVEGFFICIAHLIGDPGLHRSCKAASMYTAGAAAIKNDFTDGKSYRYILVLHIMIGIYILKIFKRRISRGLHAL